MTAITTPTRVPAKNLRGIMTYVRPEVYDKLKLLAEKDERSISNLAAKVLSDWIEERSINPTTIATDKQSGSEARFSGKGEEVS
jgi:hypothetical protein